VSIDIDGFHMPPDIAGTDRLVVAEQDGVRVLAPVLDAALVSELCIRLKAARTSLMRWPVDRVIAAIDSAARRLRDPGEPARATVLQSMQSITGYSAPMAELVLDRMAEDWLQTSLEILYRAELGGVAWESPALGLHVFAGNVPGVNVTSIVRSLLVRTAVLGKSSVREPVLAAVFAKLLAEAEPELGACVAVTYWRGGDTAIEKAVLEHAGIVVHYGGAEAITSLEERAPDHVRFVEHGPRISFAIINGADQANAAAELARAVAVFDQHGCVSPQVAWFVGDRDAAVDFAMRTAEELQRMQQELPRGRIDAAESAAIRELRARFEFRHHAGEDAEVWGGDPLLFTVAFANDAAFEGSCLNRTIVIKRADDISEVVAEVEPYAKLLQTVGMAGFGDDAAGEVAALGATRVAPIGEMPWPPVTWHHDGRRPLRELVSDESPVK
jgi:hypothetical protein